MLAALVVEVVKFSRLLKCFITAVKVFKRTLLVQLKLENLKTLNRNAANNYRNQSTERAVL